MSRKKILIADDTELFRELEAVFLARVGDVFTAASGKEALQIALRERPDVVVADIDMPSMDGETLCRAIKADRDMCSTPVVLVISGDAADDHARAVRAHADDVLVKPLSRIGLNASVARMLRQRGSRSLARVAVDSRVRVRLSRSRSSAWGVARDLSRGGIFVESRGQLPPDTEVDLDFRLPDHKSSLRPSARVIWTGRHPRTGSPGMGLRFISMDRTSCDRLDDYVHERGPREQAVAAP